MTQQPSEILTLTSKLIFVPAIVALGLRRWGDVCIVSFQAVTAIWYHSSHTPVSYYVDQLGIWLLVVHTLLLAQTTPATPYMFVLGFGYMFLMYFYGKCTKRFCFDPNTDIADRYHASMHVLGIAIYSGSMIFFLPDTAGGIFDKII